MQAYRYKAVNEQGRTLRGTLDAINQADLEVRLSRMGLDLINFRELRGRTRKGNRRGVKRVDLITFCIHLEQLLAAGVPMLEGLTDLRDSTSSVRLREVTSGLIEAIEGGRTLSASMSDYPAVFGSVFVNLVKVGEQSGQLPKVLRHIVDTLKWQDEQSAFLMRLFMYPALMVVTLSAVMVFLMVYLVPELLKFVKGMGETIPFHTQVLIAVSGAFASYWYLILGIPLVVFITCSVLIQTNPRAAFLADRTLLRVPVIGPIFLKIILTRFVNFFAIMYASGIPVLESMRLCAETAGNRAVQAAVLDAARQIGEGSGIAAAFESTRLFPPLVLRMLKVGESTGSLEQSLANVTYFYTREVRESIEQLQSMIGPALTIVLGGLLGWVMLSVLGPIYDLISRVRV
jgi:type IV pilus assembly protein PilC